MVALPITLPSHSPIPIVTSSPAITHPVVLPTLPVPLPIGESNTSQHNEVAMQNPPPAAQPDARHLPVPVWPPLPLTATNGHLALHRPLLPLNPPHLHLHKLPPLLLQHHRGAGPAGQEHDKRSRHKEPSHHDSVAAGSPSSPRSHSVHPGAKPHRSHPAAADEAAHGGRSEQLALSALHKRADQGYPGCLHS